jgi:hypothetical protein
MQKACDEENACVRGLYSDCLTITYASAQETWIRNHSYSYEGNKGKQAVKWTPEHDYGGGNLIVSGMPNVRIGGRVADTLHGILKLEPLKKIPPGLLEMMDIDPRRISLRMRRELLRQSAFSSLRSHGFKVTDFSDNPMVV